MYLENVNFICVFGKLGAQDLIFLLTHCSSSRAPSLPPEDKQRLRRLSRKQNIIAKFTWK